MYTAYTRDIDTVKVILGVDTQKIDPVATQKKIKPIIEASTEFKIVQDKFNRIKKLTLENQGSKNQGKRVYERVAGNKFKNIPDLIESDFTSTEMESLKSYQAKIKANLVIIETIQEELKPANEDLKVKSKEIALTSGIYFDPNPNEIIITKKNFDIFKAKLKAKGKDKFLTESGELITDHRNKKFYSLIDGVWEIKEIKTLNEEIDLTVYIPAEDLTDENKKEMVEQFESDRIGNLTDAERENEIKMLKESAVQGSINMRSRLEIEGDDKALEKSRSFYAEQVDLIDAKYGV